MNRGNSLYKLRKYAEAIECFNKALQIDTNYQKAYFSKGCSLHELGKYTEAIEC